MLPGQGDRADGLPSLPSTSDTVGSLPEQLPPPIGICWWPRLMRAGRLPCLPGSAVHWPPASPPCPQGSCGASSPCTIHAQLRWVSRQAGTCLNFILSGHWQVSWLGQLVGEQAAPPLPVNGQAPSWLGMPRHALPSGPLPHCTTEPKLALNVDQNFH